MGCESSKIGEPAVKCRILTCNVDVQHMCIIQKDGTNFTDFSLAPIKNKTYYNLQNNTFNTFVIKNNVDDSRYTKKLIIGQGSFGVFANENEAIEHINKNKSVFFTNIPSTNTFNDDGDKDKYIDFEGQVIANKCVYIKIELEKEVALQVTEATNIQNVKTKFLYIVPLPKSSSGGSIIMQLYKKYCK